MNIGIKEVKKIMKDNKVYGAGEQITEYDSGLIDDIFKEISSYNVIENLYKEYDEILTYYFLYKLVEHMEENNIKYIEECCVIDYIINYDYLSINSLDQIKEEIQNLKNIEEYYKDH